MSTSLATDAVLKANGTSVTATPTITVKHGSTTALTQVAGVVSILGGISAGVATLTDNLPGGLPADIGIWIAGIGMAAGVLKLAIVAATRAFIYSKKANAGLFDVVVPDTATTTTTETAA